MHVLVEIRFSASVKSMEDEVIEFPSPLIFLVNLDDGYSGKSRFVKDERGVLRKLFWKGLICWMISSKILFLFS